MIWFVDYAKEICWTGSFLSAFCLYSNFFHCLFPPFPPSVLPSLPLSFLHSLPFSLLFFPLSLSPLSLVGQQCDTPFLHGYLSINCLPLSIGYFCVLAFNRRGMLRLGMLKDCAQDHAVGEFYLKSTVWVPRKTCPINSSRNIYR